MSREQIRYPGTCPVFRPSNGHDGVMSTGAGHWRACPVGRFGGRGHVRFSAPRNGHDGVMSTGAGHWRACHVGRSGTRGHVRFSAPSNGHNGIMSTGAGHWRACPVGRFGGRGTCPVFSPRNGRDGSMSAGWGAVGARRSSSNAMTFMAAARRRPWGMLIHQCQVAGTCSFLAPRQRGMFILGIQTDGSCPVVDPSSGHGGTMPNLRGLREGMSRGEANQRGGGPRHAPRPRALLP